jgi:hypothetical protein
MSVLRDAFAEKAFVERRFDSIRMSEGCCEVPNRAE